MLGSFYKLKNTTTPEIRKKKQPDAKISPFSLHLAKFKDSEKCFKIQLGLRILLGDSQNFREGIVSVFISTSNPMERKLFAMVKIL